MSDISSRLAALSPEKRRILALALQKQGGGRDTFPLSFAQQRLWFLDQWSAGSAAYNSPMALRLAGRLDADALARALSEIVRRHEALRTVYLNLEGRPVQTVQPAGPVALPVDDLSALPPEAREAEARRVVDAETGTPFDLARGPMLRARLLRLGAGEHVLVVVTHHVAFDGSAGIFFRELSALYAAFARGWASPLPEPPIQYADFAVWQRDRLQGELLSSQLAWWRERLAGAPAALQLPVARPVPRVRTDRGEGFRFAFPAELSERARSLARAEGATVFMTLLAAWDALLHRYTGEDDLLVGTPIQVRSRAETEGMIGCFTNTVVVRASAEGNPTFREMLRRVRAAALGAFAHGEVPFEKLVDELHPERDPGQNPLFQVMFVVHPGTPAAEMRMGDVSVVPVPTDTGRSRLSILMGMTDGDDGLSGVLEYSLDLFDHAAVERMLDHFRSLLEAALADPETRLLDLPLLSEMETRRVLHEWNDTDGDYPRGVCIHELFEARAAGEPDAVAVVCGDHALSYGEVEREANRLARRLRGLGVGPGAYVGVHLERSAEMVPALLGILKAGGVYVPVEIGHPAARMAAVLGSLEVACVVTQTAHADALLALAPALPWLRGLVCVDRGGAAPTLAGGGPRVWTREETDALPDTPVDSGVGADDLAYVIFTSGSTGAPKGVMVRHAPAVNLIDWVNGVFGVGPEDRVLFVTSLSFDLSVYDVFGLLAAGGSVRVATAEEARDPERLVRVLAEEPVTFWDSAPAALQQLVPFFGEEAPAALRLVFLSGDWIPVALPDQVRHRFTGAEVVSLGGATEATVWSNFHRVGVVDPDWTSIPYGRPMRNARYYVLDERMQPAPTGVAGDLYIGGEVLAEGYAAAPELTATKFVPDPFGGAPGARIYRTGDRARFWWDGTMEFLGRLDHQVKVRGFRIELGEIETALAGHPALRDVVVAAREDEPRVKRLVAYVVPRAGGEVPASAELRAWLRERLPEYMVPSAFVALDSLPVTPNGKLDRRALPAPQQDRPELEHGFEAPRTDAERTLAAIWAETLRVRRVGIHDNFFELGGDSILSIQVVARAAAAGMKLSPQLVFRNQTVAELAMAAGAAEAPRVEEASTGGEVPLTPAQRWFFEQELPEPRHWNQSLVLEATGPVDAAALERALAAVLAQHDSLRLRFRRTPDGWTQAYAEDGTFPLERVDLAAAADAELAGAVREHGAATQAGLDLEHGPLARAALFDLGPARPARLLLAVHHLVVDGVSWRALLEDLETAYRKLARGEPLSLPAKTASYRSWAERLAEYAGGAPLAEAAFWRDVVAPGAAALPVDDAGGDNTEGSARTVTVTLDHEETRALLTEVPRAYHTRVDEVLLAALAQAAGGWTDGGPLLLDLEAHGREELFDGVDLSRTVGGFTSIYPVRLEVAPGAEAGEALRTVKEQLRRVPRQGIGWGLLRYASFDADTARALAEAPRPQLAFNYLGQFDAGRSADALFRITTESAGPARAAANPRTHLLEVNAAVADGELRVGWTYGAGVHREEVVRALAGRFLDALRGIMAHCRSGDAGGYTPSDFPSVKLNQKKLDRLMGRLAKAGA
ncbi:MAG TPA: amino acid adenylation domain-containing protein [Longimicrobiaceae bacterium]|nr:amino acid adenylation domain-containing protein [Longimicrobiaceae bacterium]